MCALCVNFATKSAHSHKCDHELALGSGKCVSTVYELYVLSAVLHRMSTNYVNSKDL